MPVFAAPWALTAAVLAAWLLWRARQPQSRRVHTVANLFLWRDGRTPAPAVGEPDRRRPPWLVWVQALALTVLALAAAGPTRRPPLQSDGALIIDLSPSMGARDGTGTRLDLARAAARAWLRAQPARARIAVVAAGRRASDLGAFRADDAGLDAALTSLVPEGASPDWAGAVTLARAATAGPIAAVSDAPAPIRATGPAVEWLQVGSPLDNIAIVAFRAGGAGRALIEVQNFGERAQPVALALKRGEREIWRQSFAVEAGATRAFLPAVGAGAAPVTALLQIADRSGDALDSDNSRTGDVSGRPPIHVMLVTAGNRFLEQALRALPDVTLTVTASPPSFAPSPTTIVVCDGCSTAPPRPSLWLAPAPPSGANEAAIAVVRADHALLRGVDLSDARVTPVTAPIGSMPVLATVEGRPLIAAEESTAGRQVVLATDLARSSLPLTVAFPVFIANAVEWLAGRAAEGLDAATIDAMTESDLRRAPPVSFDAVPAPAAPQGRALLPFVATLALFLMAFELAWRRRWPWLRTAAVVSVVGAIAGARIPGGVAERTIMFAVDGSASVASVRRAALDRVTTELKAMSPADRAGVVVFGQRGERVWESAASRSLESLALPPPAAVTNIAAGITSAQQLLPASGDRRIVLLSDGQPTAGDALAAAAASGVPIDTIPLDDRNAPVVRHLDAPLESRSGAAISISADVEGAPGTSIAVDLVRDGSTIGTRQVAIDATGHARTAWTDTPPHPGVIFYHAIAMDPRLGIAVSEAGAGVTVGGRGRMLIVTDRPGEISPRFRTRDIDIDERTAEAMPDARSALAPYSVVVLDAIAPHRLNARQLDALSDAIALDGAGLLMLGDRESLNASEFVESRFTAGLPIDFTTMPRPPASAMALALLVDTSGSMATTSDGVTKISAARDAVMRALAVVPAEDAVQVVGFSAVPAVILPAGASRDAAAVTERVRAMTPSGGTALTPALTLALTWLRGVSNPVRRILLVSDGRTTPADAESAQAAVAGQSIEVSVVAIGHDADRTWLTGLARSTGGRAYFPDSLRDLSREVAREAARGASGREIDVRFRVRAGAHPLAPATPPELGGYVAGRLRPGAAAAWMSPTQDPVLAAWSHGAGRVAVLASDLRGPWGAPLANWPEGSAFWRRAVAWLSRATEAANADAQLETGAGGTRLIVDTGTSIDGDVLPTLTATILTPSGTTIAVPLHAVSSTRAEAAVPLVETGDYRATIVSRGPRGGSETRFMRGWYWNGDVEAQARGVNLALLQQIADRSGGTMRPAAADAGTSVFDGPRTRASRDAATALLLIAAVVLFWDYSRALTREARR